MPLVGRRELAAHVDHHHQPAAALLFDVIVCRVMGHVAVDQPLAVTQRLPDDIATLPWTDIDGVREKAGGGAGIMVGDDGLEPPTSSV